MGFPAIPGTSTFGTRIDLWQGMRPSNMLPLLALLPLSACITSQDQLLRSNTTMSLPLGAIHVPPRDSGIVLQGSVAIQASPGGTERVKLTERNGLLPVHTSDQTSDLRGPSSVTTSPLQIAAEGSIFLSEHLRLGAGLDASSKGTASWGELGLRFGKDLSVETFVAAGASRVRNSTLWNVRVVDDHSGSWNEAGDDSTVTETPMEQNGTSWQDFVRAGVHVTARDGGPFAEYQVLNTGLLDHSPRAGFLWGSTMHLLGTGWSQPTGYGTGTVYVRALYTGKAVIPSLGLQWTGELKLGG